MNGKLSGDNRECVLKGNQRENCSEDTSKHASADNLFSLVHRLRDDSKPVSALVACRSLVSSNPSDIRAWELYLDICTSGIASMEERFAAATGLLEWRKGDKRALKEGSEAALELKRRKEAQDLSTQMVELLPSKPVGWLLLSKAYRMNMRPAEALAFVDRALYLNPSFASALIHKAAIVYETGDEIVASSLFKSAMLINPALARKIAMREPTLATLLDIA